ncbi:MAG: O-antigen ligase family protein [Clostridia bacterium]|nr:O-antigen ligase family protein [Clostridia bacterium]
MVKVSGINIIAFVSLWYFFFQAIPVLTPGNAAVNVALGAISAAFLLKNNKGFNKFRKYWSIIFFLIFISLFFSFDVISTWKMLIKTIAYFLVAEAITNKKENYDSIIYMMEIFLIIALIVTYIQGLLPSVYYSTIVKYISKSAEENLYIFRNVGVTNGVFVQTGMNAFCLSVGFIIVCSKALYFNKYRVFNLILSCLFMVGIFMTGKRSFFIILIALVVMNFYIKNRQSKNIFRLLLYFVVLLVFYELLIYLPKIIPSLEYSYSRIFEFLKDQDIGSRKDLYAEAIRVIKANPLGVGYGAYPAVSSYKMDVHNSYLQIIAEMGWVFGILFFIPCFYSVKRAGRILNKKIYSQNTVKDNFLLSLSFVFQIMFYAYALSGNPFDMPVFMFLLFVFQKIAM